MLGCLFGTSISQLCFYKARTTSVPDLQLPPVRTGTLLSLLLMGLIVLNRTLLFFISLKKKELVFPG